MKIQVFSWFFWFFALVEDMWQERYFTLFRQKCLSNVDKGEVQIESSGFLLP